MTLSTQEVQIIGSGIAAVVTLYSAYLTSRTSRRSSELDAGEKRRASNLEEVKAASVEWRSLYDSTRAEMEKIREDQRELMADLQETKDRVSAVEQVNKIYRSILSRLLSYLKWIEEGIPPENLPVDTEPEPLRHLIRDAESIVTQYNDSST